jgi:hypothetical protein
VCGLFEATPATVSASGLLHVYPVTKTYRLILSLLVSITTHCRAPDGTTYDNADLVFDDLSYSMAYDCTGLVGSPAVPDGFTALTYTDVTKIDGSSTTTCRETGVTTELVSNWTLKKAP